jgi:hypothetical protein
MNRAMPSRAAMLFALALLPIAVAIWVRSYWRFDAASAFGFGILSESGEVYAANLQMSDESGYWNGKAGSWGRLEVETGLKFRPWFPVRTWTANGNRFISVQWWAMTLPIAGMLWWCWRRRRGRDVGFPVVTP